jgi:hypothetical protein
MALDFFYQIQLGSVYLTSTGSNGGYRNIAEVDGLDAFDVTDGTDPVVGQDTKSLNGTAYTQLSEVVDAPIVITLPLMLADDYDDVAGVFNAYNASPSPFTAVFTGTNGSYTGTGKPCWNPKPISRAGDYQNDKYKTVTIRIYMTLS